TPKAAQRRLLLAEDNPDNVATLAPYLEMQGYEVLVAADGAEAIALATRERPDLIVMDVQMPNVDGLEAMGRIRANPETAAIPMIALTAFAMAGDEERCLAAGANAYLSKPVKLKQLAATIRQWLSP
ncbi:MAG: response regulator, partial [Cyanobacteria bacterium]|nr:response regulator [Cyanobacteriota bacterium]